MSQNPAHHIPHQLLSPALDGQIDVEAVAGPVGDGLGAEIGVQTVSGRNGFHHGAEGHRVVGCTKGIGIPEIDLVLPRALLVMAGLRADTHPLQGQTDLPADILAFVLGGNIHVAGMVIGNFNGFAVVIQPEQVELQLRTDGKHVTGPGRVLHRPLQNAAGIMDKQYSVLIRNGAVHPHHPAAFRPPGQHRQRGGVGMQEQIRMHLIPEPGNGGGIDGNAVFKGPFQLMGHDGDVLGMPPHITERQADELHILLLDILHDLLGCVLHFERPAFLSLLHTSVYRDWRCPG